MDAGFRIAVAGATGAVGRELIALLAEREVPCVSLRLMASSRSAGEVVEALGRKITVEDLAGADPGGVDVAFFSAGSKRAREFAPAFADAGAWVIDNSSAFREEAGVPLVVPEINGHCLEDAPRGLIANPNCSTIIALLPLAALHSVPGIEKALISTYQAVSGAGGAALRELETQMRRVLEGQPPEHEVLPRVIHRNLIPWIGDVGSDGYCEEERKIAFESRKILDEPDLAISATTVRVPVRRCHSMTIWVRLRAPLETEELKERLRRAPGVRLADTPPCPADLEGTDHASVGRIRRDPNEERAFWMWVVADQLRKGAALNAVQIMEKLIEYGRIS